MYWDGERWLASDGRPIADPQPHPRRQPRDWISTAIMVFTLVALIVPLQGAGAAGGGAVVQLAATADTSTVILVQESSREIRYSKGWTTADDPSYLGGHARQTTT